MKEKKLILASNIPAEDGATATKVVGAKMQRFCNCNPHKRHESVTAKVDAGASRLEKTA